MSLHRRYPYVLGATVAGLAGLLSYHTEPLSRTRLNLLSGPSLATPAGKSQTEGLNQGGSGSAGGSTTTDRSVSGSRSATGQPSSRQGSGGRLSLIHI